jgi:hypothetical protein
MRLGVVRQLVETRVGIAAPVAGRTAVGGRRLRDGTGRMVAVLEDGDGQDAARDRQDDEHHEHNAHEAHVREVRRADAEVDVDVDEQRDDDENEDADGPTALVVADVATEAQPAAGVVGVRGAHGCTHSYEVEARVYFFVLLFHCALGAASRTYNEIVFWWLRARQCIVR